MALKSLYFLAIILVALILAPAMTNLIALPRKASLSGETYLLVQGMYAGSTFNGVLIGGAIVVVLFLAFALRRTGRPVGLVVAALLCLLASQSLFWILTYPVNQATANWTMLPTDWQVLRLRRAYANAAGAIFDFGSLVLLVLSSLTERLAHLGVSTKSE